MTETKLRILHVANVRWFNATAWYAMELARLQTEAGHHVHTVVLPGSLAEAAGKAMGLCLIPLHHNTQTPWGITTLGAALVRILDRLRPQVVTCHRGEHFWLWVLLRRLRRDFVLIRTRGDQRLPRPGRTNRLFYHYADAVISTNSAMTCHLRETFGLGQDQLFQILGGVDTHRFSPDPEARHRIRSQLGLTAHHLVVGLLGRLDTVKGQKEAIAALRQLHDRGHTHIHLLLLGFSSALSQEVVEQWIAEAGLTHAVTITGKQHPIAHWLSAADLAVVPSLWSEAIARAALEWMACRVPVIASRVGVLPDLFSPEALVPPGDVPALADAMEKALDPAWRAARCAEQNQRLPHLTSAAFLDATMAVYHTCLHRCPRTP